MAFSRSRMTGDTFDHTWIPAARLGELLAAAAVTGGNVLITLSSVTGNLRVHRPTTDAAGAIVPGEMIAVVELRSETLEWYQEG